MSESIFPKIIPIKIGTNTATSDIIGTWASPDAPNATNVKNGPSFIDNNA